MLNTIQAINGGCHLLMALLVPSTDGAESAASDDAASGAGRPGDAASGAAGAAGRRGGANGDASGAIRDGAYDDVLLWIVAVAVAVAGLMTFLY